MAVRLAARGESVLGGGRGAVMAKRWESVLFVCRNKQQLFLVMDLPHLNLSKKVRLAKKKSALPPEGSSQ